MVSTKIHPKLRYSKSKSRSSACIAGVMPVAIELGFDKETLKIESLSGGFMNANCRVQDSSQIIMLRQSAADQKTTLKESTLLSLVKSRGVSVPKNLKNFSRDDAHYAVHEFIDGISLEDHLLSESDTSEELFFDLGAELAKTHSVQFESDGFLGADLEVVQKIEDSNQFFLDFMRRVLAKTPEYKLSKNLNDRFLSLIDKEWSVVSENQRQRRLTHFDFNPKNILVSPEGAFFGHTRLGVWYASKSSSRSCSNVWIS